MFWILDRTNEKLIEAPEREAPNPAFVKVIAGYAQR
jgi:hypothetical protein